MNIFIAIATMLQLQKQNIEIKVEEEPPLRTIQQVAYEKVSDRFGSDQWESFNKIVQKESGWDAKAQNPHSTAKGLCQFLSQTRKSYRLDENATAEEQINACIAYIADRYKTPNEAWSFHQQKNWY